MAYEVANGPIGGRYSEEALASIQEQLQHVCRVLIAQSVEDGDEIPELKPYPRPGAVYGAGVDDGGS